MYDDNGRGSHPLIVNYFVNVLNKNENGLWPRRNAAQFFYSIGLRIFWKVVAALIALTCK
jgi:hypothetical protein